MRGSDHRLGLLLVSGAAGAWSLGGLLSRLIRADSWTMIAWRGLFGAAGLAVAMLVLQTRGGWRGVRELGWLGWMFVAQSAAGMIFYLAALRHTTVASVAVIYATAPFLAAALSWLALRERPALGSVLASAAALVGVAIMVGFGGDGGWVGDLYALGMTLSMAVATVVARHFKTLPVLMTACLASLASALVGWPWRSPLPAAGHDLALLAVFGIVNFAIGVPLFAAGAKRLPAIETALLGSLEAPLAPLWVWLALDETPGPSTLIGGTIVFAAVAAHLLAGESRGRAAIARVGLRCTHLPFEEGHAMKLSARNVLPATVKSVTPGAVDSEVIVELAPGIEVVAIITKSSAEKLALRSGAKAYAIIKASNVMIGVD
ncbi:MAG TPA: EamA family transporter [Steroidobacteraceae bacterium]|nr:EamA family transporter [Steroidobacteraceae bacterium]